MRGRGKRLRELSVVQAFDLAKIQTDANNGKPRSLKAYLDDLLPDAERAALSEDRFFAQLDRQIGGVVANDG